MSFCPGHEHTETSGPDHAVLQKEEEGYYSLPLIIMWANKILPIDKHSSFLDYHEVAVILKRY